MTALIHVDHRETVTHHVVRRGMDRTQRTLLPRTRFLPLLTAVGLFAGLCVRPAWSAEPSKPLRVCLVSGSLEYKSDESLSDYQAYLEKDYPIACSRAFRRADDDLPGLENLEQCDVMLLFTRRLTIDGDQLERVKAYCRAGRPVVGLRTASHAFQNWLELDKEILGGNYLGHYDEGPRTQLNIVDGAQKHPILAGFKPFASVSSLYKNQGLAGDAKVLLTGSIPDHQEPVAWTRENRGGRVFYTSLGRPEDFHQASFRRLVANALFWASRREPAEKSR